MLCDRCKKRPAVVYIQKLEDGKPVNEGLCWVCAKELGMPQIDDMMNKMGITDETLEEMTNQLMELSDGDLFELGGADTMPNFLQNLFGSGDTPLSDNTSDEPKVKNNKKNKESREKKKKGFLDSYCTNLCEKARLGQLDTVVGREKEIYRVVQILSRRTKNNPCLIGEPGVGKTSIAEAIASRIVK